MKLYENLSSILYPWNSVMAANQLKYPNNEFASHVVSIDVLNRDLDTGTGILKTRKLIGLQQKVPGFINKILGLPKVLYFLETSEVDSKNKRYRSVSTNIDLRKVVVLKEKCEYNPDASNPLFRTHYSHTAAVSMMAPGFNRLGVVEEVALNVFKNNSHRGTQLLESVLQIIETEQSPSAASTTAH